MARKYNYIETDLIRELAEIMKANKGPFTKMMLVELLRKRYPGKSIQELKNDIAGAIMIDKYCNKRFVSEKPGWWDLAEKESPNS
jgi:hypothetical protein